METNGQGTGNCYVAYWGSIWGEWKRKWKLLGLSLCIPTQPHFESSLGFLQLHRVPGSRVILEQIGNSESARALLCLTIGGCGTSLPTRAVALNPSVRRSSTRRCLSRLYNSIPSAGPVFKWVSGSRSHDLRLGCRIETAKAHVCMV